MGHFRPRRPIPALLQLTHKVNGPPSPQEVNVVSSRHTVPTKNTNIDPKGGMGVKDAELFLPKKAHFQIELFHVARGKFFNRSMSESLFCGSTASLRSVLVALIIYALEKKQAHFAEAFPTDKTFVVSK